MKAPVRTWAPAFGEFAAFATLLFVVRFVLRGHLVPQMDEECAVGGAAVEILANGIRFPLAVYAPNDYENGFVYSALMVALSFSSLGRNVLALKLPTHLVASVGAVATVWLLRSCLDELRLNARRARWTAMAVLVAATAFSPREVVFWQTYNVGIGSHAEGTAIDMALLAWFARRRATWSRMGTAAFWALVGLAVHLNRGTVVLVPVLAVAELRLARSSTRSLAAAALGFLLGTAPEWLAFARGGSAGGGWSTLASKLMVNAKDFPTAFVLDVLTLADYRYELLATWILATAGGLMLTRAPRRLRAGRDTTRAPSALGMTLGFLLLHVAGLAVMAQGGIDNYALHVFPPLVVVSGLLAGWLCSAVSERRGARAGICVGAIAAGWALLVHRPDALRPSFDEVSALWTKRESAACSWRLGEAFVRVQGQPAANEALLGSPTLSGRDARSQLQRERHAITLCRSLSEPEQILDCIGGVGRDSHFGPDTADREPPTELTAVERRAYAFYFGVRTSGDTTPCNAFLDPILGQDCRAAVEIDCFTRLDISTRFASGRRLGRPQCALAEAPMDGYWAEMRRDILSRPPGTVPEVPRELSEPGMRACASLIASCYPP